MWGFWVVADSAQFSTIVTESVDARYVGTALTAQLATGFVLTVFTIFLVPEVRDAAGWGWAFLLLARRIGEFSSPFEHPLWQVKRLPFFPFLLRDCSLPPMVKCPSRRKPLTRFSILP